jgi:hypothetical protein
MMSRVARAAKAFGRVLRNYKIGDAVRDDNVSFQFEIFGGNDPETGDYSGDHDGLATVRDGWLVSIDDPRDESLPLIDYYSQLKENGSGGGIRVHCFFMAIIGVS